MTATPMTEAKSTAINWMDILWLVLLAALALLPPVRHAAGRPVDVYLFVDARLPFAGIPPPVT